ncbi:hypothetical protein F504_3437 [Ralstonia pseudosolanacearum FQY_4]|nr:hypothetical protein F504_3437 [Ralstonia pseudosolanacearum FQY_4]
MQFFNCTGLERFPQPFERPAPVSAAPGWRKSCPKKMKPATGAGSKGGGVLSKERARSSLVERYRMDCPGTAESLVGQRPTHLHEDRDIKRVVLHLLPAST